jgi:acetyl esterase
MMDILEYRRNEERLIAGRPNLSGGYPYRTFREASVPTSAGSTRILTYLPRTCEAKRLPVYINLHGGGFVLGFPEVDDPYCRRISDEAQCVVVNVDYALAPEHPFPAAVEECYDVAMVLESDPGSFPIDPTRIAVGGHSAGGNLAAAVCLLARQRSKPRIVLQILDYAVLDLATSPRAKHSEPTPPDDLVELSEHYNAWYLQSAEDARNPLASPALAQDLAGLPAALIITAENDVLRDEGELYAERLRAAGVPVVSRMYRGCGHGFTHIGPREAAEDAWRLICARLREAFHD